MNAGDRVVDTQTGRTATVLDGDPVELHGVVWVWFDEDPPDVECSVHAELLHHLSAVDRLGELSR
jgi:hypothetical protein